jgi:ribosome maturation protein Sdo1
MMGVSTDERNQMLQANEKFVIVSVSRMAIADMCNDRIEEKGLSISLFKALCEALAEAFSQLYDDDLSEEVRGDEERDAVDLFLQNFV